MKYEEATGRTVSLCLSVLRKMQGGPTLKRVVDVLESGEYLKLLEIGCPDPESCDTFAADYFAYNLLRKYPFKGRDRRGAALDAFKAAEAKCFETNVRLTHAFRDNIPARDLIYGLRGKIESVLGRFCWDEAASGFSFGPGASTRLRHEEGDAYYKFSGRPETTRFNLPAAVAAVGQIPMWWQSIATVSMEDMFTVVPGGKITTVPKNAKTDRTIAIEPDMNLYVQKGIGAMLKRRLLKVGVDLRDQGVNQDLAKQAFSRGLATIDLSAASDSVSFKLVELLLPEDWFAALQRCRSPRYILDGETAMFHKFSTMGNGYTFELESLIFWAITSYVIDASFVRDRAILSLIHI